MTLNIIAEQVWRYNGTVLRSPGRPDQPVGPFIVTPPPPPPPPVSGSDRDLLVYGTYKPDNTTTGPNPGTTLTTFGSPSTSTDINVTANGQVIDSMEIWGRINIGSYSNVTISNCIIHGTLIRGVDTAHVIAQGDDLRGALIIDSILAGRPVTVPATYTPPGGAGTETLPNPGFVNGANEWCGGIRGGNYTIRRCEVTNVSDGLNNPYNCLIEGNWIHGAWFNEWDVANATTSGASQANSRFYPYSTGTTHYTHCDGIQFSIKKNVTIRGNMIGGQHIYGAHNATPSQAEQIRTGDDFYNSCILIKQESTSNTANYLDYILVENNWFAGSVCSINWPSDAYTGRTYPTVVFRSNRFLRKQSPDVFGTGTGQSQYILAPLSGGVPQVGDRAAGVTWATTKTDPLFVAPGAFGWTGNVFDDTNTPVTISSGA